MQGVYIRILKRFILLAIIQILVLRYISIAWDGEVRIMLFIYPLFVLLMPLAIPRTLVIFLSFIFGLIIDMFYDSPGLHAIGFVFIAWLRNFILRILQPVQGYTMDSSLTIRSFGINWFLAYSGILLFLNILIYFTFEAFAFKYLPDVFIKTILSFIVSEILIILYVVILNPK